MTQIRVPVPARAPGAALRACVFTQQDYLRRGYRAFLRTGARDSVLLGLDFGSDPSSLSPPPVRTVCNTVADSLLDPGDATIILHPLDAQGSVPFVNAIQLEYASTYTAVANRSSCTSGGGTGALAIAIGGFTDANLRAFEITSPKRPAAFDLAGAFAAGTLTLHDSVATGNEHAYLVVPSATIPSLAVELDRRDDVLQELASAPLGTYDCLVVTHDSFADSPDLARWIAFRASQGHRIRVVRTSDAYDAFRGGLPHYEAIRRLCVLAFQNWGIESVLLVGDGSEDARGIVRDSGPNLVPARVRYYSVTSSSGGDNIHRNDMNDKWYAQMTPTYTDPPDVLIGRWPVATADELRAVVDKTLLYEQPAPGDDGRWRKRVVMLSDDEWIKRNVPDVSPIAHRRGCSEVDFERSIVAASDLVDRAFPGDLHAVRFLLREHSNRLCSVVPEHCAVDFDSLCLFHLQRPHASGGTEVGFYQGASAGTVGKAMIDSVGDGALFLALQSHASRAVVADEFIMSTLEPPFAPAFRNDGKPFVFFGFGCHLNEYGVPSENGAGISAGDAIGERLVLVPSRGAVASYASTGFEYLQPNNDYHELMWDILFNKRYRRLIGGGSANSDTLAARWRLAEVLQITEIQNGALGFGDVLARYNLLGDPLLQLDAGTPRVRVDRITNGRLQANNRFFVENLSLPLGLEITLSDEQGIDSLWAVKRFRGGTTVPIDSVTITARLDTLPQVRAKRSVTVAFQVLVEGCDFDIVVGGRDLAGRVTEFVGGVLFDNRLLANGVAIEDGAVVDPRTTFRFEIGGCAPIPAPLPLEVYLDGSLRNDVVTTPDSSQVNWKAEFTADLGAGPHTLRFVYEGRDLAVFTVTTGSFSLTEVLVFPNPMRKQHRVTRVYFHLGEPVAGGGFRIVDLNGRTVVKRDLRTPGVVRSDLEVPPGGIGSGTGQDDTHWNYIEWDGRDGTGDTVANGVYLCELSIQARDGRTQRHRDKIVLMR